jgi:hypothetical protein
MIKWLRACSAEARHYLTRCRRPLVIASAGAGLLATGALTLAVAGPAAAQGAAPAAKGSVATGLVYLASSPSHDLFTPKLSAGQEMGVYPYGTDYYTWNMIDEGYWTAAGVAGEGYEIQAYDSNLCVGDTSAQGTTGQGGASGQNQPTLRTCGANGTIWIASANGDGYFLYDRYLLDNGGYPCILGVYSPGSGTTVVDLVNQNFLNSNWFVRWQFPIP